IPSCQGAQDIRFISGEHSSRDSDHSATRRVRWPRHPGGERLGPPRGFRPYGVAAARSFRWHTTAVRESDMSRARAALSYAAIVGVAVAVFYGIRVDTAAQPPSSAAAGA